MQIPTSIEIGARIRKERHLQGMSQEDIGKALNVTYQQVQKYETGQTKLTLETYLTICEFLKISPEFILQHDSLEESKRAGVKNIKEFINLPATIQNTLLSLVTNLKNQLKE